MDWILLIGSGVLIGIMLAAPIGPVNLICIRRTLRYGPLMGFLAGTGAALGDGVFAAIAAFGVTLIRQLIEGYAVGIEIVGGIILIGFGIHAYFSCPRLDRDEEGQVVAEKGAGALAGSIASTFVLTVTNPATFFGSAAMIAGLSALIPAGAGFLAAGVIVAAVVAGSLIWWAGVTLLTGLFHARIDERAMRIVNRVSGVIVFGFGLAVLGHAGASLLGWIA